MTAEPQEADTKSAKTRRHLRTTVSLAKPLNAKSVSAWHQYCVKHGVTMKYQDWTDKAIERGMQSLLADPVEVK